MTEKSNIQYNEGISSQPVTNHPYEELPDPSEFLIPEQPIKRYNKPK